MVARAFVSGAVTAGVFTALLHGSIGPALPAPVAAVAPHLALGAILALSLRISREGSGGTGTALIWALVGGLSLAGGAMVHPALGAAALGLGLGILGGLEVGRALPGAMAGLMAGLAASLVYGTLKGAGVLGADVPRLLDLAIFGGVFGGIGALSQLPAHLLLAGSRADSALEVLAGKVEPELRPEVERLLDCHRRVEATLPIDRFSAPGSYLEALRRLDAVTMAAAQRLLEASDPQDGAGTKDLDKRIRVLEEQLAGTVDPAAREGFRTALAKLEERRGDAGARNRSQERARAAVALACAALEEAEVSALELDRAPGDGHREEMALLGALAPGRAALPSAP